MKAGLDGFGLNLGIPTENVLVQNITCDDDGRGGFAIGSEMSGGVRNVVSQPRASLPLPSSSAHSSLWLLHV
jgi:polygalacturonase